MLMPPVTLIPALHRARSATAGRQVNARTLCDALPSPLLIHKVGRRSKGELGTMVRACCSLRQGREPQAKPGRMPVAAPVADAPSGEGSGRQW